MKAHYLIIGILLVFFTSGCIQPEANGSYGDSGITPTHAIGTITELPPDNAPSTRDTFFFRFSSVDNPANYTSFCPPSYIPAGYSPYGLYINTVWNETEPDEHRTTVCEILRYGLNITPSTWWTWSSNITLLEVSWSEYGFNPYEKNAILDEEPEKVEVGKYEGLLYETEDFRLVTWTAGNATYWVYGSLDRNELLQVAASIVC